MRLGAWCEQLRQDVGYGLRLLRRDAGLTLGIVLILAVALGLATAIWSFADKSLLRPLPFEDADRLIWVRGSDTRMGLPRLPVSYPESQRLARAQQDPRRPGRVGGRDADTLGWGTPGTHAHRRRQPQSVSAPRHDPLSGRSSPGGNPRRPDLRLLERAIRRRPGRHRLQPASRRRQLHHRRHPRRAIHVSAPPRRVRSRGLALSRPQPGSRNPERPRSAGPVDGGAACAGRRSRRGPDRAERHRGRPGARLSGDESGDRGQHGPARAPLGRRARQSAADHPLGRGAGPARGLQQRGRPSRQSRVAAANGVRGALGPGGGQAAAGPAARGRGRTSLHRRRGRGPRPRPRLAAGAGAAVLTGRRVLQRHPADRHPRLRGHGRRRRRDRPDNVARPRRRRATRAADPCPSPRVRPAHRGAPRCARACWSCRWVCRWWWSSPPPC